MIRRALANPWVDTTVSGLLWLGGGLATVVVPLLAIGW